MEASVTEDRLAALANREESEVKLAYEISLEDHRPRFAANSGSQGSVTNSHGACLCDFNVQNM